ncbi:MAG: hypothetical protein MK165_08770 [Pirellulaceae bacterium]|nr:hypothetical protein [Pirellulaceae bacterium]
MAFSETSSWRVKPTHSREDAKSSCNDGFDFTGRMRVLCEDLVNRLPELSHIDLSRVLITFSRARNRTPFGMHASLTPMRFEGGATEGLRHGQNYEVQRIFDNRGREMLYILSFFLPRFMDSDFNEKLVTVLHELWHISPDFNGDLRRHPGRCYAHTHSQKEYDLEMAKLADRWLAMTPPESTFKFLRYDFTELQHRFGRVFGIRVRHPKLIPV